jgi:hypothetical protein
MANYDDIFMGVASQQGSIQGLLQTFCSFLHRRTDFYVVDPNARRPTGFAPGEAERILLTAFASYPFKGPDGKLLPQAAPAPSSAASASSAVAAASTAARAPRIADAAESIGARVVEAERLRAAAPPAASAAPVSPYTLIQYNAAGKQVPLANGGVGPGYWWEQSLSDLTVFIALPAGTATRDVECAVTASRLRVGIRGAAAPILDGPLYAACRPTDAVWNVEGRPEAVRRPVDSRLDAARVGPPVRLFRLELDKAVPTWWLRVVTGEGHPEIDGTAVDSTTPIHAYDEDTQAAIRKVMFDQGQKRRGLPTSEEIAQASLWGRARGAPGSPFAEGQPLQDSQEDAAPPPSP